MKIVLLSGFLSLLLVLEVEGQPKTLCNTTACILPDCHCQSYRIPNDLDVDEIPQLILFSFEGPVTTNGSKYVTEIFHRRKRKPNGTPLRTTFFATDDPEKTDYCRVHNLWAYGHEIASSCVNRRNPEWWASASQEGWENEIETESEHIISNANVRGFRSLHLQTGGNSQYEDAGSCPSRWPFTMYRHYPKICTKYFCHNRNTDLDLCPYEGFPSVVQIPILPLLNMNNRSCIYLDKCPNDSPQNGEE